MTTPGPPEIDESFETLDETVWTPAYLPAWSSRAAAAADYTVESDGLHLRVGARQRLWCPDRHEKPMRVSAVQSGNWSGPIGSTRGQQPFRPGLTVREWQPPSWGFTPYRGSVEVVCRADIGPGSMFSAWMVGLEDEPDRCGEICLVEVFGDSVDADMVSLGSGIHAFRDPALTEEFSAEPTRLDVSRWHSYRVDWSADSVGFSVDGGTVRTVRQSPGYPMQLILGVFHFPADSPADEGPGAEAELVVRRVVGRR